MDFIICLLKNGTGLQQEIKNMEPELFQNQIQNEKPKSFFKKYKKEIIIIILAILVFSLLLYFLFFNKKENINTNGPENSGLPSFSFNNLFNSIFGNENNNENNQDTDDVNNIDYYFEGLIKVWDKPVAGYGYYDKEYTYKYIDEETGEEKTTYLKKTILQFVDSETGYIYEKDLSEPLSSPLQVTDKSFPNTVRAYFMNDKNGGKGRVFIQYEENNNIKTITASIPEYFGSTANLLNIASLPDNIKFITTSPDSKKLLYIVTKNKTTNDFSDFYTDWYYINDINNTYGNKIYTSPLFYWKASLLNDGTIYPFTIPTYFESNNLYKLSFSSSSLGVLKQIYGNHNGMFFNINDNNILVSIMTGNGLKTYKKSFDNKSFTDYDLSSLNFNTLIDKCGQNDSNGENIIICSVPKEIKTYEYGLPDAWYQGMTTWDDNLYLVNNDYPYGQLLFDIRNDSEYQDIIDGKNLNINNLKTHLAFINKNDGSLWTLNIINILNTEGGD